MAASGSAGLGRLLATMEQNKGRSTVRDKIEDWAVVETKVPHGLANQVNESLFCIGNGYIGVRAAFEEGYHGPLKDGGLVPTENGTFINGFYEQHKIRYPEGGHGWAHTEQIMLNVTDSKIIYMDVDGERFNMYTGKVTEYERRLEMKEGLMSRRFVWESPKGKKVRVSITRIACLTRSPPDRKNAYAIEYSVEPLTDIDSIVLTSVVDGEVINIPQGKDPRVGSPFDHQVLVTRKRKAESDKFCSVQQKTEGSQLALICAMRNTLSAADCASTCRAEQDAAQKVSVTYTLTKPKKGSKCVLTKYIAYVSTQRVPAGEHLPTEDEIEGMSRKVLDSISTVGFAGLVSEQKKMMDVFWDGADIQIEGSPELQQAMRFNAFHLLQSMGRDGVTNIPASGLSGERYSGHYFWDTEVYIAPFFIYTNPDVAKQAVRFRISLLDAARDRAKEMGTGKHLPNRAGGGAWRADRPLGAMYPWRTIAGEECSAYFPAGSAQVHLQADIAWCLKQYVEATNDIDILKEGGAEMLIETARFWLQYGAFVDEKTFKIHCVTGPDEYTCCINNNYYTNVMAQDHLQYAYDTCYMLLHEMPDYWQGLCDKIKLKDSEVEEFKRAAECMYLPYNKEHGVHPQDDSFLGKPRWDFEHNLPGGLLTNYHYMIVYSHAVIKQADLIMAMVLQGDKFTGSEKKRNFDYYEPLCTHDSSLSPCVHGVIASEIGYYNKAYNYYRCTVRTDIDDLQGKTYCGIHTANMGGAWMCVVKGFGGMRVYNNLLHLNPYLPTEWKGYSFKVAFRGGLLKCAIKGSHVTYTCEKGKSINFVHANTNRVHLRKGKSISLLLKGKFAELSSLNFDSVIFDIDALLPGIQDAHYQSWKVAIDAFLEAEDEIGGKRKRTPKFTADNYIHHIKNHIKGRTSGSQVGRFSGLADFLRSVGYPDVPYGAPQDPPEDKTLCAIGNRKTQAFVEICKSNPPKPSESAMALLHDLKEQGIKVGVVSFSRAADSVITDSGVERLVDARATGSDMAQHGLRGKPYIDMYLQCVERMFTDLRRCVVFIDDPVGFAPQGIAEFKYAASVPSFAQSPTLAGECGGRLTFDDVSAEHRAWGMKQVLKSYEGLDVDVIDSWIDDLPAGSPRKGR